MTTPEYQMTPPHSIRLLLSVLVSTLAPITVGCGGSQSFEKTLDEMWQWDGGVEASRVIMAIENKSGPPKIPAAVGVTGRGLVGRALPDGKRWEYEGEVDVLPTVLGNLVLFSGGGQVVALDITSGRRVYSLSVNDRRLEGAGYDGTHSILLLVDKDDAREDEVLVVGSAGQKLFSAKANARLGTPAAIDGIGLVPYSGQYVGALDIGTGKHLGRVLVRDGIHTATSERSGIVLYGAGATLMNERVTSSPDSRSLKLNPHKIPGEPSWPLDGSKPRPARSQPVGYYANAEATGDSLKFSTAGYVATYYEVVLGFDHKTNEVRFSTHFPRAVSGGAAGKYGPTLCLENGAVVRVNSRTGNHVPFGSLDSKVQACVVAASDDKIPEGDRPPVLAQLEQTISETGPDMVAIQKVLLKELGASNTIATTEALLAIAQNPLVSLDLAKSAGTLLAGRTKGGEAMIEALLTNAPRPLQATPAAAPSEPAPKDNAPKDDAPKGDAPKGQPPPGSGEWRETGESPEEEAERLIRETSPEPQTGGEPAIDADARRREKLRPPPVGALAQALGRMKTPGAAKALAPYLEDPSLTPKQLNSLMSTVGSLGTGDPVEVEHVSHFLYQYKNTGGEAQLITALVRAAHFLFKYGDETANEKLRRDLEQSLTHPELAKKLRKNPPKNGANAPKDDEAAKKDKAPAKGDNEAARKDKSPAEGDNAAEKQKK